MHTLNTSIRRRTEQLPPTGRRPQFLALGLTLSLLTLLVLSGCGDDDEKDGPVEPVPVQHTLTVQITQGTGTGTVISSSGGINCPSTCSKPFEAGETVTLSARPAGDSRFEGWQGGGCSGTVPCTVKMSQDQAVSAAFTKPTRKIVRVSGSDQEGTVGDTLPLPLVIRVIDDQAMPVSDVTVTFRVSDGRARLTVDSPVTNINGEASTQLVLTGEGAIIVSVEGLQDSFRAIASHRYPTGDIPLSDREYQSIPLADVPFAGAMPTRVDLSPDFPVAGSQGGQGSCVGWAVAYLKTYQERVERDWTLDTDSHLFSPAFIYNQIRTGDCGAGASIDRAFSLLSTSGCATLATMPYSDSSCDLLPSTQARGEAWEYRIENFRRVNTRDVAEVKAQLAAGVPVVIGMEVYGNFHRLREGDIYRNGSGAVGYHALCLTGYDDQRSALEFINSWGTAWGDDGFGWVDYGFFPSVAYAGYVSTDLTMPLCDAFAVSPTQASVPWEGDSGNLGVTAGSGCGWSATSTATWVRITAGSSGIGNGTVRYTVEENQGSTSRTATIDVAGQTFTLTQAGQPICNYAVSPTQASAPWEGDSGNLGVTAGSGCGWSATSTATWVRITAGSSGTGNGSVRYTVDENQGSTTRTGTIVVAGGTFTVTQEGQRICSYGVSPTGAAVAASGGTGSISVTAGSGCGWSASSSVTWVRITSGFNGSADGSVRYTVDENHGSTTRTGTIDVAGRTFTVTQHGPAPITMEVSPYGNIDFGTVAVGQSSEQTIVLTNSGTAGTLSGTVSIRQDLPGATRFSIVNGVAAFFLSPGQTQQVTMRFAPTSATSYLGQLQVTHNASNMTSPYNPALIGSGESTRREIVLPAIADASVFPDRPNENTGSLATLRTYREPYPGSMAYVRFNTSSVPNGATVDEAALRLNVEEIVGGDGRCEFWRVESEWTESTLTFASRPDILTTPYGLTDTPPGEGTWSVDVTLIVKEWITNGAPNNGIRIWAGVANDVIMTSREGDEGRRPILYIRYH